MITYVDTSTLIKLVIAEAGSDAAAELWDASDHVVAVRLIEVEAAAALAAARRGRRITAPQFRAARKSLTELVKQLGIIDISDDLVAAAVDLAESEGLRGYDAVHLAGALAVGVDVFSTADAALGSAARRRGLAVADPSAPAR